ncbi:hypothetical protein [Persephonella sp.]
MEKSKRILIPVKLFEKAQILSKKLSQIDYLELGFLSEPSYNDVIRKAILIGLNELEKYVKGISDISEKEEIKKQELIKPLKQQKNSSDHQKQDFKSILGDFG